MARLTQSNNNNSQASNSTIMSTPQAVQNVAPGVQAAVRPAKRRRRYPRWFFPVLSLALLLTLGQFAYRAAVGGMELARENGWRSRVKHTLTLPLPASVRYAITPQGDKYLVGIGREGQLQLELYKTSGELLWKRNLRVIEPVFSQDGTQIFNGAEALDTTTGKVIARVPTEESGYAVTWSASGNRAAWQNKNGIHIWDRTTNRTQLIALKNYTVGPGRSSLSPNGKWLATLVYDTKYRGNVAFWDLSKSTAPELYPVGTPSGGGFSLTFSPDNQRLLYAGKESKEYSVGSAGYSAPREMVSLWTLDNSRPVYEFFPGHSAVTAVWSPNGKTLALRGGDSWSVYNTDSGKKLWSASHRTEHFFNGLYFTKDSKLYYYDFAKNDWSLEYWDLAKLSASDRNGES